MTSHVEWSYEKRSIAHVTENPRAELSQKAYLCKSHIDKISLPTPLLNVNMQTTYQLGTIVDKIQLRGSKLGSEIFMKG